MIREALSHCGTLPHTVHRLDCDTSGAMVLAKTPSCARSLGAAWLLLPRNPALQEGHTKCVRSCLDHEAQFRESVVDTRLQPGS